MKISAYVPCYNAYAWVGSAVDSIIRQTVPVDELFVVDDGSTDASPSSVCVKVIKSERNLGRGATRATALAYATGDLVLGCDATMLLHPSFLETALPWFKDNRVAAVFGWIKNGGRPTLGNRWRGRHLFRSDESSPEVIHGASLATTCSVIRKSAVEKVGGFDSRLREGEDYELSERLLRAGFDVVFDPGLWAVSEKSDTVWQALERYARWNARTPFGLGAFLRQLAYACKIMAVADLRAKDPLSTFVSLFSPYYQFWYGHFRARCGVNHSPVLPVSRLAQKIGPPHKDITDGRE
jgi:GT2 family glycosyltransferase